MVQQHAGSLIAVATLPSTPQWRAAGTIIDGWVRAELGAEETAIAQIREGLDIYASTGAALFMPYFLSLLARAYARIRQSDAGLPVIGQALEKARTTGELVWEPELLRLEGEMRLTSRPADVEGAQQCFRQAIALARQQDARSWELRSALSLARSLVAAGQPDQARRTLGDVYGWFTEGFDTPDLEDARMLLDSRLPRPENQHV